MKKIVLLLALLWSAGTLFAQNRVEDGKYLVSDSVLIHTPQGHTLSAVVVRSKDVSRALPAALEFYLYSNTQASVREAKSAADHGYVGVVADVRGKRLSPDTLLPYENEQEDVYQVIDWIARQPWCNGKVGMYGGSYSGFAQWAGLKHRVHPALKTIVPYVAGIPGQGYPWKIMSLLIPITSGPSM
jgi:putative CocE/NonD family hydrolase